MINFLEVVYAVTAFCVIAAIVYTIKSRGAPPDVAATHMIKAKRYAAFAIVYALLAAALYWYLGRSF